MKKRMIINLVAMTILVIFMGTVTFGWWIDGAVGNSVIIKSANVVSNISLFKGYDFNYDGNLDKTTDEQGNVIDSYELVYKSEHEEEQVLIFAFSDIILGAENKYIPDYSNSCDLIPTEIHTWKLLVENKGDTAGYLIAKLSENFNSDKDIFIKFLSITVNGEKIYLYNYLTKGNLIFGGNDEDLISISQSKEYIIQIQLETFENLKTNVFNSLSEQEVDDLEIEYQSLQGMSTDPFKFIDVMLSTEKVK